MSVSSSDESLSFSFIHRSPILHSSTSSLILSTQNALSGMLAFLGAEHNDIVSQTTSWDRLCKFLTYFSSDMSLLELNLVTFRFLGAAQYDHQKAAKLMLDCGLYRNEQNIDQISFFPCLIALQGYDVKDICETLHLNSSFSPSALGTEESNAINVVVSHHEKTESQVSNELEPIKNECVVNEALKNSFGAEDYTNKDPLLEAGEPVEREISSFSLSKLQSASNTFFSPRWTYRAFSTFTKPEENSEHVLAEELCSTSLEEENVGIPVEPERSPAICPLNSGMNESSPRISLNHIFSPIFKVFERFFTVAAHRWDAQGRPIILITVKQFSFKQLTQQLEYLMSEKKTRVKDMYRLFLSYLTEVIELLIRYRHRKKFGVEEETLFKKQEGRRKSIQVTNAVVSCVLIFSLTKNAMSGVLEESDYRGKNSFHSFVKYITRRILRYYPSMVEYIIITNKNGFSKLFCRYILSAVESETRRKMHFCSLANAGDVIRINKLIGKENLPSFLGGICTCETCELGKLQFDSRASNRSSDEQISTTVSGGQFTAEFGVSGIRRSIGKSFTIAPRNCKKLFLPMNAGGQTEWDFFVHDGNRILFNAVFLTAMEGEAESVVKERKVKKGFHCYSSRVTGTLILEWKNTSNFLFWKTIDVKAECY